MSRLCIIALLLLPACNGLDMQGHDPNDYYAAHPIENKVGSNGELISPEHCPDWRTSPVTTFSNGKQGNIGCASVTNLGLMLENPRDLERGASGGQVTPDSIRSGEAIRKYRSGVSSAPSSAISDMPGISSLSGSGE